MPKNAETLAAQSWGSVESGNYDQLLMKIGMIGSEEMSFGHQSQQELKASGIQFYNSMIPQIKSVVCDSTVVKNLSDATAKDIILTVAPLIGQGIPTALAIAVAAIAVKQALMKLCGEPLQG